MQFSYHIPDDATEQELAEMAAEQRELSRVPTEYEGRHRKT